MCGEQGSSSEKHVLHLKEVYKTAQCLSVKVDLWPRASVPSSPPVNASCMCCVCWVRQEGVQRSVRCLLPIVRQRRECGETCCCLLLSSVISQRAARREASALLLLSAPSPGSPRCAVFSAGSSQGAGSVLASSECHSAARPEALL